MRQIRTALPILIADTSVLKVEEKVNKKASEEFTRAFMWSEEGVFWAIHYKKGRAISGPAFAL